MSALETLHSVWQDLRYGARLLRKSPGFTAVAVLTLGLGIGAATAIFSVVDATLLKPLPYKNSDRLIAVWLSDPTNPRFARTFVTYTDFAQWKHSSRTVEEISGLGWPRSSQNLLWKDSAQRVMAISVTEEFFALLGVPAAQGRTFTPEDVKNGCSVVLSHRLWQSVLGGIPGLAGTSLNLNGDSCAVLGIMPSTFDMYPPETDLWTLILPGSRIPKDPRESTLVVVGRLRKGVLLPEAQAELADLHREVVKQVPAGHWLGQFTPVAVDLREQFATVAGNSFRTVLYVLMAAVVLVLLIACVNVTNLLLSRGTARQRELAIRTALGSARFRLVRQILTECMLLSLLGAALGVLLAWTAVRYFHTLKFITLPPGSIVAVNLRVLGFALIVAVLDVLLFGLIPALKTSRIDPVQTLRESGTGARRGTLIRRIGKLLVITEVALSLILLAGAALLMTSIARLSSVPLGYRTDHILTGYINLPPLAYPKLDQQAPFCEKLLSQLRTHPRVEAVAVSTTVPPNPGPPTYLTVAGKQALLGGATVRDVLVGKISQDFFRVLDIPLLRGRLFQDSDNQRSQPVAIVNDTLVRKYFPGEDAIGRQIKTGEAGSTDPWMTIVGVVRGDKRVSAIQDMAYDAPLVVFRPIGQAAGTTLGILVRVSGDPTTFTADLRSEISAIDKSVPLYLVLALGERLKLLHGQPQFRANLLGVFSSIALLLAAIGIYGVLAQSVTQRTQEIGIRMAIGAQQRDVFRIILGEGTLLTLCGLAGGIAGALALTRLIRSLLYETSPADPSLYLAVSAILAVVALAACYIPARRATRVDPVEALRSE
jgi:putative ABC transport system permease protein